MEGLVDSEECVYRNELGADCVWSLPDRQCRHHCDTRQIPIGCSPATRIVRLLSYHADCIHVVSHVHRTIWGLDFVRSCGVFVIRESLIPCPLFHRCNWRRVQDTACGQLSEQSCTADVIRWGRLHGIHWSVTASRYMRHNAVCGLWWRIRRVWRCARATSSLCMGGLG